MGIRTIKTIADALDLPLEQVLRAANIIPKDKDIDEWVVTTSHKLQKLSPRSRDAAERMIDSLLASEEAEPKAKSKPKASKA